MSGARLGLGTRLQKLRAMSLREIAHRVEYDVYLRQERRAFARQTLAPEGRLRDALDSTFRSEDWRRLLLDSRAACRRWFPQSIGQRPAMTQLFETAYAVELADMRVKARDTRHQQFTFFGERFHYTGDIPWQADPVTGSRWPELFHADVKVHRGDVGFGDVKHVWELSRQQYLIDLGKSVFLDNDTASLATLETLVRSWIAGNPYATGVNWSCALEPAFRSLSWLWAYFLARDALSDSFHLEWLEAFYDHGRFIEAHLEHYTSPYNHLIGEAAALYLIGASFPEFKDAARWRRRAREVLERRLGEQFYADGGSVEQSTFYHHATVGYLLMAALVSRTIADELPDAVWRAIERGLEFSMALMQPDGRTPEIGGADDGKPIRMEHLPFWDFGPYLSVGAVLFGRGDFKARAGRFHEDAFWLLGPRGLEEFNALAETAPEQTSVALPDSGYYVLRSDWTTRADYVCFDCGEQAAGMRPDGVPNSMHGHADCLSVVVWLQGRRVLVDSGLYAYNCGGEWEAHFRETAAHNTARVDDHDQATHLGKMAWSHSYRAHPEGWHPGAPEAWVVGAHDGYDRGPDGVTHRRAVWFSGIGYVVIADEFVGTGAAHALEVNYQFAPGASLGDTATRAVRYGDVATVRWSSDAEWQATRSSGGDGPDQGWIAPSLGVRCAAPRLTLRAHMDGPQVTLVTLLAVEGASALEVHTIDEGFEMRGTQTTDVIRVTSGHVRLADEPLLTITRTAADGARQVVHVTAPAGRLLARKDMSR